MQRLAHIYRLGLKELTSLRHDIVLLVFLLYAFSVAIYMPAKGSIMGVHNASVAIVDEDRSALSRKLADALLPPEFQAPVPLAYDKMDSALDNADFTFVLKVPPTSQSDLRAGRQPQVQLNVDATAMSQAFMGAGYLGRIFQRELLEYSQQTTPSPIGMTTRALFNPNLQAGWFLAVVLCTWVSLELVVKGLIGVPLAGPQPMFLAVTALYLFASTALGIFLATLARSIPQFGLLSIPVIIPMLLLSGGTTPLDSMPTWLQWVMQVSPSTHFVSLSQAS